MSRSPSPLTVRLDAAAAEYVTRSASAAHPYETGGLLLGYRKNGIVVVFDAVEVADPDATPSSYTSREPAVQAVLDKHLLTAPPGTGYVGPWHAHPAVARHSLSDKRALKRIAWQYAEPVASLVAQRTVDQYLFEVLVGHGRRVKPGQLQIEPVSPIPSTAVRRRGHASQDQLA